MQKRASGVLMPLSSLPSPYGIGTMGKAAYEFVDFLASAGQKYWQLLPLGPIGYGDSPYAPLSAFAGNPYYIDLDTLIEDGLLTREEVSAPDWGCDPEKTDYGKLFENRFCVLRKAFNRGRERYAHEMAAFAAENESWLPDYALYMAVKSHFGMQAPPDWPDEAIRTRKPEAVKAYREKLSEEIAYYSFLQFLFFRQWEKLKRYANEKGILLIGDIPIYAAMDSAEPWSERSLFQLNEKGQPERVAGVPPDGFTPDGQLWGNPLYRWDRMKEDGYRWWIRRIAATKRLYDVIRIDHFRGLESYWSVPAGDKTAAGGVWMPGPGMDLVGTLQREFPSLPFIAEDLGYITPEVEKLLRDSGFPGMKVLQFGFSPDARSDALPCHLPENIVCYAGTHDNDTVKGWVMTGDPAQVAFAREYLNIRDGDWSWSFIRAGMGSVANLFIACMWDLLEKGSEARMKTPGSATGNWQWRMSPGSLTPELTAKLRRYTEIYDRIIK